MSTETIAKICHAANRAYSQTLGDHTSPIWECTPVELRNSVMEGVEALKKNPTMTPEQMHEAWAQFRVKQGWKYGPRKDEKKKEHPNLVNYDQLSDREKQRDILFSAIVRSFMEGK